MQTTTSQLNAFPAAQPAQNMPMPMNASINVPVVPPQENKSIVASATPAPSTTAKVPKAPGIKSATLVNFLNSVYKGYEKQEIKFKSFEQYKPKTDNKAKRTTEPLILDVTKFNGLNELRKALSENPSVPMTKIIERTFDLTIRSVLDITDQYNITDKNFNILRQHLIPQLNLPPVAQSGNPIDVITKYLRSNDYFMVKAYNKTFPHAIRDASKEATLLNVIYLQQSCKYQNRVLQMMINEKKQEKVILMELLQLIANDTPIDGNVSKEDYALIKQQLRNPKLVDIVLGVQDVKDVDKIVAKLNQLTLQGTEAAVLVTPKMKKYMLDVIRELNSIKGLYKLTEQAFRTNPTSNPAECLAKYGEFINKWATFTEERIGHVNKSIAELQSVTASRHAADKNNTEAIDNEHNKKMYEIFIRYFIDTCRFITDLLGLTVADDAKATLNAFITELRKGGAVTLSPSIRKELAVLVAPGAVITQELINEIVNKYYMVEVSANAKSLDPMNSEVYGKIGKLLGVPLENNQFRIAIGVAIMHYIQQQLQVLLAGCSHKKVNVIIKV